MSLILGFDNVDGKTVSPALEAKGAVLCPLPEFGKLLRLRAVPFSHSTGITHLRAAPSELLCYGIVKKKQPVYGAYLSVLPAFMHAQVTRARTDTSVAYYPVRFPMEKMFPLDLPMITVHFDGSVPAGTTDLLKTIGYTETVRNGKNLLTFPSISREQIRTLSQTANCSKISPAISGAVNLQALGVLTLVQRIMSNALIVHHFPAFRTKEHMEGIDVSGGDLFDKQDKGKKRAAIPDDGARKKKRTTTGNTSGGDEDDEMEFEEPVPEVAPDVVSASELLAVAQPPPTTSFGWGNLGQLPVADGAFVPFIPELASRDKKMVPRLINEFFLGCLGTSPEQVKVTMQAILAAFGVIAQTDVGDILAHIALCMMTALRAQTQCFPIFQEGRYEGSALLGAGVTYVIQKKLVEPVPHDKLREIILGFGSHVTTIRAIVEIVGEEMDTFKTADDEEVDTMMKLRNWLAGVTSNEQQRDDVLRIASRLSFGRSWDFNSDSITTALELMASDGTLPTDLPIHHSCLFVTDRDHLVLSAFGVLAPSPAWPSAKVWSLERSARPPSIHFHQVSVMQAVHDYKAIRESKLVTVPDRRRRSGPYKDMDFKGDQCKAIFLALGKYSRAVVAAGVDAGMADQGGDGGNLDLFAI